MDEQGRMPIQITQIDDEGRFAQRDTLWIDPILLETPNIKKRLRIYVKKNLVSRHGGGKYVVFDRKTKKSKDESRVITRFNFPQPVK